jgi:hypothetical protein
MMKVEGGLSNRQSVRWTKSKGKAKSVNSLRLFCLKEIDQGPCKGL